MAPKSLSILVAIFLQLAIALAQDGATRDERSLQRSRIRGQARSKHLLESLDDYHLTLPTIVNHRGEFISNIPHHQQQQQPQQQRHHHYHRYHDRRRRSAEAPPAGGGELYYRLTAYDREFHLNLTLNLDLASPSLSVEVWNETGVVDRKTGTGRRCHYVGHVVSEEKTSRAAISNCNGLVGLFSTSDEEFLVEPLWNGFEGGGEGEGGEGGGGGTGDQQVHIIYRRSSIRKTQQTDSLECGLDDSLEYGGDSWLSRSDRPPNKEPDPIGTRSEKGEGEKAEKEEEGEATAAPSVVRRRRRRKRSTISKRSYVETLVVVDREMVDYHGLDNIEPYVMTLMNIVARLFRDESIGQEINIVITRIIALTASKPGLEISNHADRSLESFCLWQNRINQNSAAALKSNRVDQELPHHDNAVLLTKHDICSYKNQPCGTLGLAPVAGMCEPERSCSINEDIGLATAFTVAHEIGHNFGMQHDGTGNECGTSSGHDSARIMAAQLAKNRDPFSWSSCSRDYLTNFLDSGKGKCLENLPFQRTLVFPERLGGQIHDGDAQCRFIHGPDSTQCKKDEEDVCRELWCFNPKTNSCVTNNIPSAEGTPCSLGNASSSSSSSASPAAPEGWCYRGQCVSSDWRPQSVDGEWGDWSGWGQCSRSCGGGVESRERKCDQPRPVHGGKFCNGERLRYRSCNIHDCPPNSTDFRELQCAKFNNEPFRSKFFKWKPFLGSHVRPCALNCLAIGHNFYTERSSKVTDGTKCYPDSMNICVNGDCRPVGCDRILGSNAVEDRCRVCGGDGSTCSTVRGRVDRQMPPEASDTYIEIARIPVNAVHIRFAETRLTRNYLALKSSDGGFHINGAWTIVWPRIFDVAGVSFRYERPKDRPESLTALGPTSIELSLMVLVQESSISVDYEYNVKTSPTENQTTSSRDYAWRHLLSSECSVTCGNGIRQVAAVCARVSDSVTGRDSQCSREPRPTDLTVHCHEDQCPARWSVGDWSACSRTCGDGFRTRRVLCLRQISAVHTEDLDLEMCSSTRRPKSKVKCSEAPCPRWEVGDWSECHPSCGEGFRSRNVFCVTFDERMAPYHLCDPGLRPNGHEKCPTKVCPAPGWVSGSWGECSARCESAGDVGGVQTRTVVCRAYDGEPSGDCDHRTMPLSRQECRGQCTGSLAASRTKEGECNDISKVEYCPLVLKYQFCNRPYFQQLCCQTCTSADLTS